jgi:hypothetical protein
MRKFDKILLFMYITSHLIAMLIESSGGQSEVATPVPIPNTEVKRLSADDTEEGTLWENMPLPEVFS